MLPLLLGLMVRTLKGRDQTEVVVRLLGSSLKSDAVFLLVEILTSGREWMGVNGKKDMQEGNHDSYLRLLPSYPS